MYPLIINGTSYAIDRVEETLSDIDPIAWLEAQEIYPQVFWKEKESLTTHAAVGSLIEFAAIPTLENGEDLDIRFYGGVRFQENVKKDATWEGFPATQFWLPEVELIQEEGKTRLIIYNLQRLSSFSIPAESKNNHPLSPPTHRTETPPFPSWENNIAAALEAFKSGSLDKVVLARKTTLEFTDPVPTWPLLRALREKSVRATLFAFKMSPHLCFLGATPEKLFERENGHLWTEAVAATRARGKTEEEDVKWERELLSSDKEQREFKIVKDYLEKILTPFSQELHWNDKDQILKNSHVQHLYNRLSVKLQNTITDHQLLEALHPTPALGGFPRENALKHIHAFEPFDRGWYGSAVGVVGQNRTSLYVAIRSALIKDNQVHLFAGTGLVKKSNATAEWNELEQKIRPFTELFYGQRASK